MPKTSKNGGKILKALLIKKVFHEYEPVLFISLNKPLEIRYPLKAKKRSTPTHPFFPIDSNQSGWGNNLR
jgi:hypothetical protein